MPRGIKPDDWDVVTQIACDIVNADAIDDEILSDSHMQRMLDTLNEFRGRYGDHPALLATIGDYAKSPAEKRKYYLRALRIARDLRDQDEVNEILDSLQQLESEDSE